MSSAKTAPQAMRARIRHGSTLKRAAAAFTEIALTATLFSFDPRHDVCGSGHCDFLGI